MIISNIKNLILRNKCVFVLFIKILVIHNHFHKTKIQKEKHCFFHMILKLQSVAFWGVKNYSKYICEKTHYKPVFACCSSIRLAIQLHESRQNYYLNQSIDFIKYNDSDLICFHSKLVNCKLERWWYN